jgi:hypothetical protein
MAKRETDSVLIKKKLEQMLPNMQFSVNNDSYANGHTVRIGIKGGNIQPYTNPENHTTRYSINEYWYKEDKELTPEIKEIITKVIDIALSIDSSFLSRHSSSGLTVVLGVSTKTKSEPYIYSPSKTSTTKNSGTSSKFSKGELLRECAGWEIYKKTLPDDRIVYSVFKNKLTAPNKEDWNTIKSEVYLQSGFKYGRFGNFEKWGSMTPNDENLILNALCEVLTKYYGSTTPITTDKPVDIYINGEFFSAVPNEMEAVIMLGAKYGGKKYNEMLTAGKIVKTSDRRLDVTELEPTPTDKEKLTKAIAGLEILAAKGNEKAQKAIIGLKYILNK